MQSYELIINSFLVEKSGNIVRYTAQSNNRCESIQSDETIKALSENILSFLIKEIERLGLSSKGFRLDAVSGYGYVRGFAMYTKDNRQYELSALAFCDKNMTVA